MSKSDLNRRDFNRLTSAAFGGMLAGATLGCTQGEEEAEDGGDGSGGGESLLLTEPHVCRGLNTCKGKGAGDKNECAGQGTCATAEHHECAEMNKCKGQGGCGERPGENSCKGKGGCAVPLKGDMWEKARKNFEQAMKEADRKFGDTPEEYATIDGE